ncbi:secretion/DNA translocation related TadE-like protein [Nakamurella sp. UYEF19]|uniref:Rv3654c family TadE-like protein n=1 Tax=Nakamurella sp. UYEF19 TaxID=1756392 RepID=UPI003391DDB3
MVDDDQGPGGSDEYHAGTDDGVATIFACLAVCLMILVTGLGIRFGGAILARQQAENAADLGALAGAAVILSGQTAACARATQVVGANGGSLTACAADGFDLLVQVQVDASAWGGDATAHARAGPVTTP